MVRSDKQRHSLSAPKECSGGRLPVCPDLPEAERLERIGEVLHIAATRFCRHRGRTGEPVQATLPTLPPLGPWPTTSHPGDVGKILNYLAKTGPASPRDIREALNLPRTTAFRRLRDLVDSGQVKQQGRTRALTYHLIEPADPSLN